MLAGAVYDAFVDVILYCTCGVYDVADDSADVIGSDYSAFVGIVGHNAALLSVTGNSADRIFFAAVDGAFVYAIGYRAVNVLNAAGDSADVTGARNFAVIYAIFDFTFANPSIPPTVAAVVVTSA